MLAYIFILMQAFENLLTENSGLSFRSVHENTKMPSMTICPSMHAIPFYKKQWWIPKGSFLGFLWVLGAFCLLFLPLFMVVKFSKKILFWKEIERFSLIHKYKQLWKPTCLTIAVFCAAKYSVVHTSESVSGKTQTNKKGDEFSS